MIRTYLHRVRASKRQLRWHQMQFYRAWCETGLLTRNFEATLSSMFKLTCQRTRLVLFGGNARAGLPTTAHPISHPCHMGSKLTSRLGRSFVPRTHAESHLCLVSILSQLPSLLRHLFLGARGCSTNATLL